MILHLNITYNKSQGVRYMIVYSNKFRNSEYPFQSYEFEVLNELKDCRNRTDDNCIQHTRFLFEMDSTSLDEQISYLRRNKDYITRCVFSGSKSLHMIIQFENDFEQTCKDNYKEIWHIINQILFDSKCDIACSNPSRLTRRPCAIRADTKKEQKLIYNNPEIRVKGNVLDRIIISLRQKQRQKQLFKATHINLRSSKENPGMCLGYDVIQHYLNTNYPKLKGNGDSSISLFKALRCCIKYNDKQTMATIINKAVKEHWNYKELERMINNIKDKYV